MQLNQLKQLTLKKILGLILIGITLIIVITAPNISVLYNKCPCIKIQNKNVRNFIMLPQNKNKLLNNCLNTNENFEYYNNLYKTTIKTIDKLHKNNYITEQDKNKLFNLLKSGNILSLKNTLSTVSLTALNTDSTSNKFFLDGLVNELLFLQKEAEKDYKNAININKFAIEYYTQLAQLYNKNCNYNQSVQTLLKVSSIVNNNNNRDNFSYIYSFLGDLYFKMRDYENALVYYTNNLITIDAKNKDYQKYGTIIKIGNIMYVRGNYFEAINHYKYALSLKNKKVSKENEINLLLQLSHSYYKYGNYTNGLKFAKSASQKSKHIFNKLLYSKAKYEECLNYEFLHQDEKAKTSCTIALQNAYNYISQNKNDIDGYINIAEMLDYSTYIKNPKLAKMYFEKALDMSKKNVLYKISILEKIMSIDAYSSGNFMTVPEQNRELNRFYKKNNINPSCCNDILTIIAKEKLVKNKHFAEKEYLSLEDGLINNKPQLAVMYSYLSDYYKNIGEFKKALKYAEKCFEINTQIYRYDHHYIQYSLGQIENIKSFL